MLLVTIKDVARRAGVSTATVSRVLNEHPSIAQQSRQAVHTAIDELGYRPNAIARSLRLTNTSTVGLVLSSITNPFLAELARSVEEEARAHGYSVIIGNAEERPEQQDHYVATLLERRVDGLLIVPTADGSPMVKDAVERGDRVVLIDRDVPEVDAPTVRVDGTAAIRELVGHLAALGHRDIGMIAGPQATSTGRERYAEFRAALGHHGLPCREELIGFGDIRYEAGMEITAQLLDAAPPPSAVFAAASPLGLGALQEFRRRGLQVPSDVGLAVYDDLPWFSLIDPPITAITQPTGQLGRTAVNVLLARMAGRLGESPTLSAHLVVRRSCGERPGGVAAPDGNR